MVDLSVYRGDDKTWDLTFKDSAGTAINITGASIWLTVKTAKTDTDANAAIQNVTTSHTDAANGSTSVTVSASDTSGAGVDEFFFDIQYKDSANNINTVMDGTFRVIQDVTVATS